MALRAGLEEVVLQIQQTQSILAGQIEHLKKRVQDLPEHPNGEGKQREESEPLNGLEGSTQAADMQVCFERSCSSDLISAPTVASLDVDPSDDNVSTMQRFARSPSFNAVTSVLIVANLILVGVQADLAAVNKTLVPPLWYILCEMGFCIVFATEISIRVLVDRSRFFTGPGKALNLLDLVLIIFQLAEIVVSFFMLGTLRAKRKINFFLARVLRLVRVVRLARSIRLFSWLQEVRSTTMALVLAVRPLIATLSVFMSVTYGFGIYFVECALLIRASPETEPAVVEQLDLLFGDIPTAMYTLVHAIVQAAPSCYDVATHFTPFPKYVAFPVFMIFSTLGMLNIVTGIFVDSTIKRLEEEKEQTFGFIARELFRQAAASTDSGNARRLGQQELFRLLRSANGETLLNTLGLDKHDMSNVFSLTMRHLPKISQKAQDNEVDVDAFVHVLNQLSGPSRKIDHFILCELLADKTLVQQPEPEVDKGPPSKTLLKI